MSIARTDKIDEVLGRIATAIDADSSIPVSVQLRGALEYGIATGDIPPHTRLPSVRQMATRLRLSPVTISGVYAALQARGHIEGRVGSGTFVTDGVSSPRRSGRLIDFERKIAELLAEGHGLGLSAQDVALRLSMVARATQRPVHLVMLGRFRDATEAYAEDLRGYLRPCDTVTPCNPADFGPDTRISGDLVVCPRTMVAEAGRLLPDLPVVSMTLIPNEATRIALATLPPEAEVAVVSYFDDFLTMMKGGIARFAPHISRVSALPRDHAQLADILARADVLIHSTGAGYLRQALSAGKIAIEYRHTPDSKTVRDDLLPAIEAVRRSATRKGTPDEDKSEQLVRDRNLAEDG